MFVSAVPVLHLDLKFSDPEQPPDSFVSVLVLIMERMVYLGNERRHTGIRDTSAAFGFFGTNDNDIRWLEGLMMLVRSARSSPNQHMFPPSKSR